MCENKDFEFFFIFRGEKKGGAFAVNDAWWVGRRKKGEEGRAEGETLSKLGESPTAPPSLPSGWVRTKLHALHNARFFCKMSLNLKF